MNSTPLKVHLFVVAVGRAEFHVLKLRQSSGVKFSNNFFHETWHILGDPSGASVLARLLWGLSYQRKANTVIFIDESHLTSTPFDGDAACPILLSHTGLGSINADIASQLRKRLRLQRRPTTTVKLQTFGMEQAERESRRATLRDARALARWQQERMAKLGGVICYSAPAEVLRHQALQVASLSRALYRGMNYHYLAESRAGFPASEVQIFSRFAERVAVARQVRRQVRSELASDEARAALSDDLRFTVWEKAEAELAKRRERKRVRRG